MSRPPAARARPLPRAVVVAGVALPVLLLVGYLVGQLAGDDDDEPTAPFAADVVAAYDRANPALLALAETTSRWSTGDATDEALRGALDRAEALLPQTRAAVARLDEPSGAAPAKALFVATADLYAVVVDVLRGALRADEQDELGLMARRLRTIADRVYDRGRAIVAPADDDETPGVTVVRSAPVPDWQEDELTSSLRDGRALDAEALEQPDDEPGRRRALRLLVLAEGERATALGLDDVAAALDRVASALDED